MTGRTQGGLLTRRIRWAIAAAIGAFFLFAGVVKALDFEGFLEKAVYYRAVPYAWMVRTAWGTIGVEVLLGALLVAGVWRRLAIVLAVAMLLGFSVLVAHAWHAYGITDCGCLGSFAETPPWFGIAKNLAMAAALVAVWPWRQRGASAAPMAAPAG